MLNRVGEQNVNHQGLNMTIIEYISYKDITVKFDDGKIIPHRNYEQFSKGNICHPDFPKGVQPLVERVGEEVVNTQGLTMRIIKYNTARDIDILVVDTNKILKHRLYPNFRRGTIIDPDVSRRANKVTQKQAKERLGQKTTNKLGQECEIVRYHNYNDIDVLVNGKIITTTYQNFRRGFVGTEMVGRVNYNAKGEKMTLIAYRNSKDIDVEFEDGTKVCHKSFTHFKNGAIRNPNTYAKQFLGTTNSNTMGKIMTIVEYKSSREVTIEFEDGAQVITTMTQFRSGSIRHPKDKKNLYYITKVGETSMSSVGLKMTLIAYRSWQDVDVQFEDGYMVEHISYQKFKDGSVQYPIERIRLGKSKINNQGLLATVIAYRGCNDIDAQFEDGVTVYHKSYASFNDGTLLNPVILKEDNKRKLEQKHLGEKILSKYGLVMQVVKYRNCSDIDVQFETGYITTHKQYKRFVKGQQIGHPFPYRLGNMIMLNPAYIYNNEGNFYCKCTKCGLSDVMSLKEMKEHICIDKLKK